ncbi:hypothetical protein AR457_10920 [Streptomyces agglomeratus]|uniref:hypothetical protein n=1 Tax=Streptomyces agglomeratus TaxID=285458 RepID=UPI0008549175|nr:hypothetical protein [Streptomyces agglomeratus]OEJ41080.1 hypothetical protein BGK70_25735 [Streptomyces agglomeratus]OEJ44543.1 hypothetical protein AR457_10920 [Streptomyces agglomeratus]
MASESAPPPQCQPFTYYKVTKYGSASYKPRGPIVSNYNSSSHKSTLTYAIETTQARETTWAAELGGSVSWGIGQVEAKTSYDVTKKVSRGVTVTNRMSVDSRKRGYTQPMVEYRKFSIDKWRELGNCRQDRIGTVGRLKAITSHLHFAECQTRSSDGCRPKP